MSESAPPPSTLSGVAVAAIGALKTSPVCLGIVVLMITLSIINYHRDSDIANSRHEVVTELIERCMEPAKR